ncbi:MAG: hypothetical protein ABS84_05980 [Rubrivivax sp. SCN 71-131]|jgi:F1F0 ATPase subunit 2|nr:MAG: hypothetical protein ABS84_05980 [Rubrivivax sp. SCN 71-131]
MIEAGERVVLAALGGFALGLPASALYFAGLALGMHRALRARHPALVLLASFTLRAVLLLALGAWLAARSHPLGSLCGLLLAFLLARTLALRRVRGRGSNASPGAQGR